MVLNVVCPFCDQAHPVPTDFDSIYACPCGACYKVCSSSFLDTDVSNIAREAYDLAFPIFPDEDDFELCQVVVNREFDRLLALKQAVDETTQMRYCKYDQSADLALVWIRRP